MEKVTKYKAAACHFIGYDQLQASAECSCGTR